jgi:hypothetical protein
MTGRLSRALCSGADETLEEAGASDGAGVELFATVGPALVALEWHPDTERSESKRSKSRARSTAFTVAKLDAGIGDE